MSPEANRSATSDGWARGALADAGIVEAYRIWLGREPETAAAIEGKRGRDAAELTAQLLGSDEFAERIALAIEERRLLAGQLFDAAPPRSALDWAAGTAPLAPNSREALLQVRTWLGAYSVLFKDPAFAAWAATIDARLGAEAFLGGLRDMNAGAGDRLISGGLEQVNARRIVGWALNRNSLDEPIVVELHVNGRFAAAAVTGRLRRDLQDRFGGDGRYGFEIAGPFAPDLGTDFGFDHEGPLQVEVREAVSQALVGVARVSWREQGDEVARLRRELAQTRAALERLEGAVAAIGGAFGFGLEDWDAYHRIYYARTPIVLEAERQAAAAFAWRPRFAVVTTLGADGLAQLEPSLVSLQRQLYRDFVVRVLAVPTATATVEYQTAVLTRRLGGAGEVVTDAAGACEGVDYLVCLRPGDVLAPDALHAFAAALQAGPRPAMLYADDDRYEDVRGVRRRRDARLKPDFDLDYLLQLDFMGDAVAIDAQAAAAALAAGAGLEPDQRLDLRLRVIEAAGEGAVRHLACVVFSRGSERDAAATQATQLVAARAHLERTGVAAEVEPHLDRLGATVAAAVRVRRAAPEGARAAVIIPTKDRPDLLGPCLASVLAAQAHNRTAGEIVVVDNAGRSEATRVFLRSLAAGERIRLLTFDAAFNWAAINNFAAGMVEADVLVFLNNDTVVLSPDWLDVLAAQAMRPDVGAVGARLLYEDGTIQHAGLVTGCVGGPALHEALGDPGASPGYLGRHTLLRRATAVTGACLATRADRFAEVGGFDEQAFGVEANDIDYGLRVAALGHKVLYAPDCTLYHFESKTRGQTGVDADRRRRADTELATLSARWGEVLATDPFYNPHFDRYARPFTRLRAVSTDLQEERNFPQGLTGYPFRAEGDSKPVRGT